MSGRGWGGPSGRGGVDRRVEDGVDRRVEDGVDHPVEDGVDCQVEVGVAAAMCFLPLPHFLRSSSFELRSGTCSKPTVPPEL